jgi:hypothetical protein
LYVSINSMNTCTVTINLFDFSGRLLRSLHSDNNSLGTDNTGYLFKTDVSDLSQGAYVVTVQAGGFASSRSVMVTR